MTNDIKLPDNTFSFAKQAAFKSEAQRRKFYAMMNDGEISPEVVKEWEDDTPKNIPERITKTANFLGHLTHVITHGIGSLARGTTAAASSVADNMTTDKSKLMSNPFLSKLVNQAKNYDGYAQAKAHGFSKFAGGPGSGVKDDNTKPIDMPLTPYITIMKRKAFMDSKEPFLKDRLIEMANIKYVGQEKYVPVKLARMLNAIKDKNSKKNPLKIPIDVTLLPNGEYAVLDGHHRFLAARKLKKQNIKANVYTVTKEDKAPNQQQIQKVAFSLSGIGSALSKAPEAIRSAFSHGNKLDTMKSLGKGAYNLLLGGKSQGKNWDPKFGLKSIGRAKEKVTSGPTKGMYKYDQYGDHVYDMNKKRDWMGYIKDEFSGASRTRADLAAKEIAKKKGMNVGEYMSQAGSKQKARLKNINNMKVTEFIKKHPALAANYYGRNVLQKGLVAGFPAYTAYDLASGNAYRNNPHNSKLGTTLGSLAEGVGFGLTGPLGIAGSMASSLGAGAIGRKAGDLISPKQTQQYYR